MDDARCRAQGWRALSLKRIPVHQIATRVIPASQYKPLVLSALISRLKFVLSDSSRSLEDSVLGISGISGPRPFSLFGSGFLRWAFSFLDSARDRAVLVDTETSSLVIATRTKKTKRILHGSNSWATNSLSSQQSVYWAAKWTQIILLFKLGTEDCCHLCVRCNWRRIESRLLWHISNLFKSRLSDKAHLSLETCLIAPIRGQEEVLDAYKNAFL